MRAACARVRLVMAARSVVEEAAPYRRPRFSSSRLRAIYGDRSWLEFDQASFEMRLRRKLRMRLFLVPSSNLPYAELGAKRHVEARTTLIQRYLRFPS